MTHSNFYTFNCLCGRYNYYGSEPLYSGLSGTEMHAEIYIGCVYYQRLRHMVSDKSQVRGEIFLVPPNERTCSLSLVLSSCACCLYCTISPHNRCAARVQSTP